MFEKQKPDCVGSIESQLSISLLLFTHFPATWQPIINDPKILRIFNDERLLS